MNKTKQIKIAREVLNLLAEHDVKLHDVPSILSITNVLLTKTEKHMSINIQSLNSAYEEYISSIQD